MKTLTSLCMVGLLAIAPTGHAVQCVNGHLPSNPDSIYQDHGDGTVTDTRTGLMWKRCSEGQSWTGSTCSGTATTHKWSIALALAEGVSFAGHSDWRLPNIKELSSLVELCRFNPSINDAIFPNNPSSWSFWSGSPLAIDSLWSWYVGFGTGGSGHGPRANAYGVRLVRVGQETTWTSRIPESSYATYRKIPRDNPT